MKTLYNISEFDSTIETIVTIGVFDGVHIGHREIIRNLVQSAKQKGLKSVLLTFFPHPRMVLQKDTDLKLINTIEEKIELLSKTDLDYLIVHPFDKEFSKLDAHEFSRDILVAKLNTKHLTIGYDHRFGKNREGSFQELIKHGYMYDFEVSEIPAQDINEISVSSTKIRNAILNGDIETANEYLTYDFYFEGTVVKGNQLGAKIGVPTANISIKEDYKIIAKEGVYAVLVSLKSKKYLGMMNIGHRPTVGGTNKTIEVHILDFKKDIYGSYLKIEIVKFIREQVKFENIDLLKDQLYKDKQLVESFNADYL